MKQRVAVIGSGIAGMSAAYYLRHKFDVTIIEKDNYVGGHTNTVNVKINGRSIPVDTGFMVYNETTYPNLVRLFNELGVTSYDTSMSFGVRNEKRNLEYACSGFTSFFAQRRNIASPRHWKLYRDIIAFFKAAESLIEKVPSPDYSVAKFAHEYDMSAEVMENFVVPMAGAIWSTPPEGILDFPALPLFRFMQNHRMLGIGIQLQWKTVEYGSDQYKRKLLATLDKEPEINKSLRAIGEDSEGAYVVEERGQQRRFDYIVVATHADQALALLEKPTDIQRALLSCFKYNTNQAILHSDSSVMPLRRAAWASWNVLSQDHEGVTNRSSTHYWMNNLQNLDTDENVFVSIDYPGAIDPDKIHWQATYQHPRFDAAAIRAQPDLGKLNSGSRIRFCGSYFRNGFHEDALWSSLNAVQSILNEKGARHELMPL